MKEEKIVDEISVPLVFQKEKKPRFFFLVFSSRAEHHKVTIDYIERALKKEHYELRRLDEYLKSEDSQYAELVDLLKQCSFAIIILDGFRPNVIFEYGILKGLGKPCIVLLEQSANIDVKNYFPKAEQNQISNPKVDMNNHFSDVKDRYYINYNKNDPKVSIRIIRKAFSKLENDIKKEFMKMIFPNINIIEKQLHSQIKILNEIDRKPVENLDDNDKEKFNASIKEIDKVAEQHNLKLNAFYYVFIVDILLNFKEFEDVLKIIDFNLGENKNDLYILNLKSQALVGLGRYDDAITIIDKAIQIAPKKEANWHEKGIILDLMGKTKEAKMCYKKGIDLIKEEESPEECTGIHFLYGISLYYDTEYRPALEQFELILKIEETDDDYLVWKAKTLQKLGDNKTARTTIEEALQYNNKNADAWATLGGIESDINKKIEYFDEALKIDPNHCFALCSKAATLANLEKNKEALIIFFKVKDEKICPSFNSCTTVLTNIGRVLGKNKKYDDAIKYIDLSLKLDENNIINLVLKADLLIEKGKKGEVSKLFKKALEQKPKDAGEFYCISSIYARLNKIDETITTLKKAIKLDPSLIKYIKKEKDFDKVRKNPKFKKEFG